MVRFLASSALTLLGNAVGLLVAALLLPNFHIQPLGFIVSVLFFTGVEIFLRPFIIKMSLRYIPAISGGIALVTTLVGLLLTSAFTDGIRITGLSTWILAPLVIWLSVVLAGIILPMFLFKQILSGTKQSQSRKSPTLPL